jgi:hypothetical protein
MLYTFFEGENLHQLFSDVYKAGFTASGSEETTGQKLRNVKPMPLVHNLPYTTRAVDERIGLTLRDFCPVVSLLTGAVNSA